MAGQTTLLKSIALVDENYVVWENQNIVTENGAIAYMGGGLPEGFDAASAQVYEGRGKIALPGFYNLHCHIPMTLIRGYGEGLPLQRWLEERMFPFEALMDADDMYWGSLLGMAELLRSGAVSFTDMYMELDGIIRAVAEAGMKANLSHGCGDSDENARFVGSRAHAGTKIIQDYARSVQNNPEKAGLIIPEVAIHAEYTNAEGPARSLAEFAVENGLGLQVHVSETEKEHEECKARRNGRTPAEWLRDIGAFDGRAVAAHCVWVEAGDMAILADKGVTVAHCPSSNLKLGSGIAPIRDLVDAGVPVAIGTDGAASNNNLNMLEEVSLAALVQKGANRDPLLFGPAKMLELACKNGAAAQGREGCGALKTGNRADIVVYDLRRPETQPVFDMLSNVLFAAQADAVCLTMVDGKVLYKDGEYTTIDIEKVLYNAARIRDEKLAKLTKSS